MSELDAAAAPAYTLRMAMESFRGEMPDVAAAAFVAASADLIGRVMLAEGSSVWYNTTLRGDLAPITLGRFSNVQDNCCLHVDRTRGCHLGDYVTVGHSVTLHACTVEDCCLIGMGATVLDGAVIGHGSIVGANALVTKNTQIPPHSLVLGSPAKVVKSLPADVEEENRAHALDYWGWAREYADK